MKNKKLTVSFEEAQKIILDSIRPLDCENISILDASNRVLYEDIVSDIMIPPLNDSAMDGYAIIANDTLGASQKNPITLQITGEISAGSVAFGKQVSKGTAIRIMTGAPIPPGADAVVQFEDTAEESGRVKIFRETDQYKNYRFAGENIKKGDQVLFKGDPLRSANIGILASLNYNTVKVYRQPTVAIISTGDEIAEIGSEMQRGQIRNINAYTLYSEAKKYNALPEYLGIAKDTLKDVKEIFLKALQFDVILSTGGVSMGKYDLVKEIYADLDIEILFEWIRVKPGRPCTFGKKGNRLFFGLPGNPVSTLTSFIQFVRPALLRLMGARRVLKPVVDAVLEKDIRKEAGKVHLLRGRFTIKNNEFFVSPASNQKSSVLRSLRDANCLIVIPENITEAKAGEKVAIQLIDHNEIS